MQKKLIVLLIVLLVLSSLSAKGSKEDTPKKDIVVFAAASMTETLTKLKGMYEDKNPSVNIVYNFDSSGTLKTQLEMGADCDLFLSAAQKQMNALEEKNLINKESRINLLENKTALAVPKGNPKKIASFDELAKRLKEGDVFLAIGNSDVPVGQYTKKIFEYYDIDEEKVKGKLTYGSNVKEVTTQVSASAVDCGIIYQTDAFSQGLEVVDRATEAMTGGRVIYPAALLKKSSSSEAKAFLEYLKSDEAMKVFESVGFSSAL